MAENPRIHEGLYTDEAAVYREQAAAQADGSICKKIAAHGIVRGRLSSQARGRARTTENAQTLGFMYKFFCGARADIKEGDVLKIIREGEEEAFLAGRPVRYAGHTEVLLGAVAYP